MHRRLRYRIPTVLGLLALATAIWAASAGAATKFESESYSAELSGTNVGTQTIELESTEQLTCQHSTFTATLKEAALSVAAENPHQTECEHYPGIKIPEYYTGCTYTFYPGQSTGWGTFKGTVDLSGCNNYYIFSSFCSGNFFHVIAQTGLPVTYTAIGSGSKREIEIGVHTKNLKYNCGGQQNTHEHGSYDATWRLSAKKSGSQVGAWIQASTEGKFTWDEPGEKDTLSAEGVGTQGFGFRGGEIPVNCTGLKGGGPLLGSEASTLNVSGLEYSGCTTLTGLGVTTLMNGCHFRYGAVGTTGSDGTEGTLDIVCLAGSAIEMSFTGCRITIPAQEGLGPVYYYSGATSPDELIMDMRIGLVPTSKYNKAISYSTSKALCGITSPKDGTYSGKTSVRALNGVGTQTGIRVH